MSQKEVKRSQILDKLKVGKISQQAAAQQMDISTRQVRRLAKHYQREGLAGLISKKRGCVSNRRLDETIRATAIQLIGAHYWKAKRGGGVCAHPIRECRARFSELIQIDGSPHDWFEGRGERCTLLVFIDDATGKLAQLCFMSTETTLGYMEVLRDRILAHGVPVALYSDKHSIFRINAIDADPEAETQFSRAARELSMECIHARRLKDASSAPIRPCRTDCQGNAAGWHQQHGHCQRLATRLHYGLQPTFCVEPQRHF